MIPHNNEYAKQYNYVTYDSNGNVATEVHDLRNWRTDTLWNVNGLTQGDFKSATAFRFTKTVWDCYEGSSYAYNPQTGNMIGHTYGNTAIQVPRAGPADESSVYNEALSRVGGQIRAGIDWSVNALQAAQVASMVRNANRILRKVQQADLSGVYNSYVAYKRFQRSGRRGQTAARRVGGAWLAWVYGVKPLAQDIYNTAVELGRDFPSLMIAEAKVARDESSVEHGDFYGLPRVTDTRHSVRCQMKIRYSPNASTLSLLSNFTSLNPASMAWESFPFSFVADWVYDVGGYMRALETSLLGQSQFLDGFVTFSQRVDNHSTVVGHYDVNSAFRRVAQLGGSCKFTSLVREPLRSMPFPRAPVFNAELGSGRLLNAAALISQALGRR